MADAGVDCCALCVFTVLESWCTIHPFGADVCCCGGSRGCCGSCCDSAFNEDGFDERLRREQAKNGVKREPVDSQPLPSGGMSTVGGDLEPTSVEI